jgi:hypothetical protein
MAKVLGGSARYVTRQSIKKYQRQFVFIILVPYCFALILGFLFCYDLNKEQDWWITILSFIMAFLMLALSFRLADRVSERLERKRIDYRKGATSEALMGYILESLPDNYVVIHGVKPRPHAGDIDHIVVGPSGVYAIDTKNWRGVVAADGKGELLLNGKPIDKPAVKNLFSKAMIIKEKIRTLSALDPFIRTVLAFPRARVEAKWGSTGPVHCVTDEKLYDYIVGNKKKKTLTKKAIVVISQAFLALARMDKDFVPDSK